MDEWERDQTEALTLLLDPPERERKLIRGDQIINPAVYAKLTASTTELACAIKKISVAFNVPLNMLWSDWLRGHRLIARQRRRRHR